LFRSPPAGFQLPLSGSPYICRWNRHHLRISVLSTPSLGITDHITTGSSLRAHLCLSTPSLGITYTRSKKIILSAIGFQLPLSGSPPRVFRNPRPTCREAFQLPLSGSLMSIKSRWQHQNTILSTPSLGITLFSRG